MSVSLTPRELDVMSILWKLGDASVQEVRERLDEELAYTSVLSVLQLLEQKGHVGHRKEGRAYRYHPVTEAEEAGEPMLERVLETLYQSSPVRMIAHLVESRGLTGEERRRIQRLLEADDPGGPETPGAHEDQDDEGRRAT